MASSTAVDRSYPTTVKRTLNARILERHDLNASMSVWRVSPDGPLSFVPGQHVSFGVPTRQSTRGEEASVVLRPYSISSSAFDVMSLEFLIRRVEGGEATEALWDLKPGDAIWMRDKAQGRFTSQLINPNKKLILLATGTGLGPFMSVIRTLKRRDQLPPTLVVHGVRSSLELVYFNELTQLTKSTPSCGYVSCVTRDPHPISGHRMVQGRISALLESGRFAELTGFELNPNDSQIMLCGNPDMVSDSCTLLEERYDCRVHTSSEPGNVFFERYW